MIAQSRAAGTAVPRATVVALVVAKAPPPPSTRPPAPPPTRTGCDPSYPDVCLEQGTGDYDCSGGSGNGPNYVDGPIVVRPPDPFDLDANHDGTGCENG